MEKNKLIFMHIPKCGGTTFSSILQRIYPSEQIFHFYIKNGEASSLERFISLSSVEKDKIHLLRGHVAYGVHNFFFTKARYITFLRDPIERIISFYYFAKRKPNINVGGYDLFNENITIQDFVLKMGEQRINNGQVRYISGVNDTVYPCVKIRQFKNELNLNCYEEIKI